MEQRRRPEDDPGWAFFSETVIHLRRGGRRARIDCRRHIGAAARRDLAAMGLGEAFRVLTACHPGGEALGTAEDRRRTARLARQLRSRGLRPVRADGASPDGRHVEPGWAADVAADTARLLAGQDGQSAVFFFDGRRMWIEPVLVDAEPIPLPRGG